MDEGLQASATVRLKGTHRRSGRTYVLTGPNGPWSSVFSDELSALQQQQEEESKPRGDAVSLSHV